MRPVVAVLTVVTFLMLVGALMSGRYVRPGLAPAARAPAAHLPQHLPHGSGAIDT